MNDSKLEQRLASALEHAAPNRPEEVLSRCQAREGVEIPMSKQSKRRPAPWMAAACLALLLVGGGTGLGYYQANAVAAVVSLDVNPSIELTVNAKERVLSATALNPEAKIVLEGMELEGTPLKVAVNAIVGSLLQHGYLDELSSAILISVEDQNTERAARLERQLTGEVDAALQFASAHAAVLSQILTQDAGLDNQAKENSISVGKAALVQSVIRLNSALSFDALAKLSVEELSQLLETGAPAMPVGRSRAAYLAMEHAGVLAVNANTGEVDPELDDRVPHYDVELWTPSAKYDYEIDAYTGAVLKSEVKLIGAAGSQSGSTAKITVEQAQQAALKHCFASYPALNDSDVTGLTAWEERDDGRTQYEVKFTAGDYKFEYEIDGNTGAVLSFDADRFRTRQETPPPAPSGGGKEPTTSVITLRQAEDAALAHAGVARGDARKLEAEWDDDGHFDVEFECNGYEYDYEINPYTGAVLSHQVEYDDD